MEQTGVRKDIFKNLITYVTRAFLLLLGGVAGGYFLLMSAYLLPVEPMQENLSQSAELLLSEKEYHRVIPGYVSTQLDNYTDSWMMGNAAYESMLPVWKRALACTSADYGEGPLDGLVRYIRGEEGYREIAYTRYWHGYLVILKPFFMMFDYADLRFVNIALQIALAAAVFGSLCAMGHKAEAWGYIVSIIFAMPVVIPLSIQFSIVFYVANIAALVLLKNCREVIDKKHMLLYFQIIGMATSYFDLLTYPIASLGVPLVCLMLIEEDRDFLTKAKHIACSCVSWGFGYGAMWAGKWALSTLILKDNVIADALAQIMMRSSHVQEGKRITALDIWLRNVEFYFEKPYIVMVVVCVAITIIGVIKNNQKIKSIAADAVLFMVIAAMPFAWYGVLGQHSHEHHWFTFRALMASVFALMCICARAYRKRGYCEK